MYFIKRYIAVKNNGNSKKLKRLKLEPEQALFLTVKEKFLPPSSALLSAVYQEFKDDDGFLYVSPPCYTHFYYIVEVR